MHLRGRHIDKLGSEDISNLIENGVSESIMLDYKEELPNLKDKGQKLKWLALVSSFANKDGGVIIYGIKEKRDSDGKSEGVPEQITGLVDLNSDHVGLQMGQVLNAGLDPKLPTPRFRSMDIDGKTIFIIGIQRSLFAPHVVWFEKDGRFWVRNNNGKEQMDVHQVRRAFLQSEEWEKEADNFRRKRLMDISSLEFTRELDLDFPYFLHMVPLRPGDSTIEVSILKEHLPKLQVIPYETWHTSVNLDGVLLSLGNERTHAYIHGFRNGAVEIFTSAPRKEVKIGEENKWTIDGQLLESYSVDYLQRFFEYATHVNISPPS